MGLSARLEEARNRFDRLSERERRMVGGLGATFGALLALGLGYWVSASLDDVRQENRAIEKAIGDLQRHGALYMEQKRRIAALEARMQHTPLELNSYVERAASAVGVAIAESGETSPVKTDRFVQRGIEIKLTQVSIRELALFVKKLESEPAHIVQVTRLDVQTRRGQNEELDVEMTVSTFSRAPRRPKGAAKPKA